MIKTETIVIDGNEFAHTYSDRGVKIMQETGDIYDEAIDILNSGHTYTETEEYITEEVEDSEALDILLGRDNDEAI